MRAIVEASVAGVRRAAPERTGLHFLGSMMSYAVLKTSNNSAIQYMHFTDSKYLDLLKDRDRDLDLLDERE